MKALSLFSLLFALQFIGEAHAFSVHDKFRVELVKPWGEFGFRAIGKGNNISEMRFDCSKSTEMGLVLSVVNQYGKTSHLVLPVGELGADKQTCQKNLKKYFANVYSKRGLASAKNQQRTVELNIGGGLFTDVHNQKTLRLL